jgi:hypothetical protein
MTWIPGFELARTLGQLPKIVTTLKGFHGWRTLSGLERFLCLVPRVVAALQPWAAISQRLRRYRSIQNTNAFGVN